jgi:hypothetical protein
MRGFLFCLVLLGGAAYGAYYFGWISFEKTDDGKTQISIDNDKIRTDTDKAIDKGRDVIDNAKDAIKKDDAADKDEDAANGDG